MSRRRGSFWPSPTQELLLRGALCEAQDWSAAWRQLPPGFKLETLEHGTMAALPLLYRRLSDRSPEDPLLPRLRGIYKAVWVKNNLLVDRLREIAAAFEQAGVQSLLIGSLSAAARYYPELALRSTPALDLLVGRGDLHGATRALGRLGWSAQGPPSFDHDDPIAFSDASGHVTVLRARAAVELPAGLDLLGPASVTFELGGCQLRGLAAGDDLLIACVAGARVKPVRAVDWIVDMVQILRRVPAELDWERLIALSADFGHTLRLRNALEYLSAVLDVQLPLEASTTLDSMPVPVRQRLAYGTAGASIPGLGSFPQAVSEHLLDTRDDSSINAIVTFPAFLRKRWEVDRGWQLPLEGSRRALRGFTGPRGGSC